MKFPDWAKISTWAKQYVWNKYVLTLLIFGLVMLFAGEQGVISRVRKARQINELEEQLDFYSRGIDETRHELEVLQRTDSLERYAREHCLMHEDGEDIYLIDEEELR